MNGDFLIWDFQGGGKFCKIFLNFYIAGFLSLVGNPLFSEASVPMIGPALALPNVALEKHILDR